MPADEHLGGQFSVFHGTQRNWGGTPQASHDYPLHVALTPSLPGDYAFDHGIGGSPTDDWETMQNAAIKQFAVSPDAKVHHTDEGHYDGILSDEGREEAKGYDLTVYKEGLGIVYNPNVLTHVRDIGFREHTRQRPEDAMEDLHGEDWRDELRRYR